MVTELNPELIRDWFVAAASPTVGGLSGVVPTAAERAVLADGADMVLAAAQEGRFPPSAPPVTRAPEDILRRYLTGVAAGIAGTRARLAGEVGGAGMTVVGGLLTGAAALAGEGAGPAHGGNDDGSRGASVAPSAAEIAQRAGVTAADLAVEGAALDAIAAGAASVVALGPRPAATDGPDGQAVHRTRALVCAVLLGLHRATLRAEPEPAPADCGATPTVGCAVALDAVIDFEIRIPDPAFADLRDRLRSLGRVTTWSGPGVHRVHLHTRVPGAAISEAYAYGTLFDLAVGSQG